MHYLLTTRDPISFMESQYLNQVRSKRRIPSMAEWVEQRYEHWKFFDYSHLKKSLGALDGISSVTFVPMRELFQCKAWVLETLSDALSLDEQSGEQLAQLIAGAPRLKERPKEISFLSGRLRYEFAKSRIPLGWAVSLLEFAATTASMIRATRSSGESPRVSPKKLSTIWRDLTD